MKRFFVTGTDTGVGKTVVSAILTLGLDGYYWKPIQAGTDPSTDSLDVGRWTGLPASRILPEAYVFEAPMSPHAAAALEKVEIRPERILGTSLPTDRPVVIEGAGGLMVPLGPERLYADLIRELGAPVIVVARTSLGTLNHTLLTLSELRRREIRVAGLVLNGAAHDSNHDALERYGRVRILGRIPRLDVLNEKNIRNAFCHINLESMY